MGRGAALASGCSVLARLPLLVVRVARERLAQCEIRDVVGRAVDEPRVVVEQRAYRLLELQRAADTFRWFFDDCHVFLLLRSIYELEVLVAAQTIGAIPLRHEAGATPRSTVTHRASKGGVAPASSEIWAASFLVAVCFVISSILCNLACPYR